MRGESRRILYFEDNYETMCPLKEHLEEDLGFSVELTADESILQRLSSEHFDLIIVDLMITNVSDKETANVHFDDVNWRRTGLEFIKRLRRGDYWSGNEKGTPPDVPILVLTAVADFETQQELRDEKHREKPFILEEIDKDIGALLGE